MFEISSLAANDTATVEIVGAGDELLFAEDGTTRLSVTVYGPGSKAFAKAQAARTQRLMDRMAKKGKSKVSAEEQALEQAQFLAACTASFNGFAYNGNATDFAAAYADSAMGWLAEQVGRFIGDWGNFSKGSAKS